MDTKKIDSILTEASVEDLMGMSKIGRSGQSSLTKTNGNSVGTWSEWAVVPEKAPDWLWKMARTADSWVLNFVTESLSLISSDVRVTPSGKPFTNLLYYASAGHRDNEILIKWSNSSPERMDRVKKAIDNGASLIGAAREGYEAERLEIFTVVFENVYKQYKNGDVPDSEYEDTLVMEDVTEISDYADDEGSYDHSY